MGNDRADWVLAQLKRDLVYTSKTDEFVALFPKELLVRIAELESNYVLGYREE